MKKDTLADLMAEGFDIFSLSILDKLNRETERTEPTNAYLVYENRYEELILIAYGGFLGFAFEFYSLYNRKKDSQGRLLPILPHLVQLDFDSLFVESSGCSLEDYINSMASANMPYLVLQNYPYDYLHCKTLVHRSSFFDEVIGKKRLAPKNPEFEILFEKMCSSFLNSGISNSAPHTVFHLALEDEKKKATLGLYGFVVGNYDQDDDHFLHIFEENTLLDLVEKGIYRRFSFDYSAVKDLVESDELRNGVDFLSFTKGPFPNFTKLVSKTVVFYELDRDKFPKGGDWYFGRSLYEVKSRKGGGK